MINILNSIKLRGTVPSTYKVDFTRESMKEDDADISLSIKTELSDSSSDPERIKLSLGVIADARDAEDKVIFSMHLIHDYFFEVIDKESYLSITDEERAALCASICYLDFRRKIINAMVSAGLSGVKLPLSLQDHKTDI